MARRRAFAELWGGVETTESARYHGHDALEARIVKAYNDLVRDAGFVFRSAGARPAIHDTITFTTHMVPVGAGHRLDRSHRGLHMLVWINEPFGGGETLTAHEIHRRLAGNVVCDPSTSVSACRMTLPRLRADFQIFRPDGPAVYEVLDLALSEHDGALISPVTVVKATYLREVV